MKVVVLGAGGVVGQRMMLAKPSDIDAVFTRRAGRSPWRALDLLDWDAATDTLDALDPDVIVNLAGEGRVDVVEQNPKAYEAINAAVPGRLAAWCASTGRHLIHASTQGVFSGTNPPYGPQSEPDPITEYGRQKTRADKAVLAQGGTVARLTFVVGVRPFQGVGRQNPVEQMFRDDSQIQVNDRFFSPLFARDAADHLWALCREQSGGVVQLGTPVRVSRYDLASWNPWPVQLHSRKVQAVSHDYFQGLAPRPRDTTWSEGRHSQGLTDGMLQSFFDWNAVTTMNAESRANEIAYFLGVAPDVALTKLERGFHVLHAAVAEDFRQAAPVADDELLEWYRHTTAYIWELSAYHLDPGFNYSGMCDGFANHLWNVGVRRPLCLGDGIGDLTITLRAKGLQPTYHDLARSQTAEFAKFRYQLHFDEDPLLDLTEGWDPVLHGPYEAIVAMDFMEHLVNVEDWARACFDALETGGWFFAQNAFSIGDDEHGGSIPMHLTRNNRFEHDWQPLLVELGFEAVVDSGGWWRKP